MAKRRRGRPVNGILVLDKPGEVSSNRALQTVKRLYDAQKAGHTGSLDPLATGVLPICFGEATKFSQFLLDSDKAYRSTFVLGVETATGDADGDVTATSDATHIPEASVREALRQFEGCIEQVPSMYSAIKHQGQPLYKLARKGVEVERKARQVTIYDLAFKAFRVLDTTLEVDIEVRCSKGTYVRSLAEDLGHRLECGGHVKTLRRIAAGPFEAAQMTTLPALETLRSAEQFADMDALLLPVDTAVQQFPAVTLAEAAAFYMCQGQAVQASNAPASGVVRMYRENSDFLGLGEITEDGRVGPKRLLATD